MSGQQQARTIGQLPSPSDANSRVPPVLTRLVWLLLIASLGALAAYGLGDPSWELQGVLAVDGLTVVMWSTVTFFSGIVHSYSRRYMAGNSAIDRFFGRVFAFTLTVLVLVAADSFVVFGAAWLVMGLVMAGLIGHVEDWPQAQAAASVARRSFLASSGLLAVALLSLWWTTGTTAVSGLESAVEGISLSVTLLVAGAIVLAAMVQSALVPFHRWLLSSMTAPTPASALMHAGFVNAGGILLVRFAPVVTVEPAVMLGIVVVGAASALLGKLLKTVQTDVKGALGCSTVGQMGFMIMQAGLGFFGAAIAHLILHGFYKAYQFLSSGSRVSHEAPTGSDHAGSMGAAGVAVAVITALVGGALFVVLTGKGTKSGLVLTVVVVVTVLHAVREFVQQASLPTSVRYAAVPTVALPAIAVYAAAYRLVSGLLAGLPAVGEPAELTAVHALVAGAFVLAYVAIESGVYQRSQRLYVALLNASQPRSDTLLTSTEEYNEY